MPGQLRRNRDAFFRAIDNAEDFLNRSRTARHSTANRIAYTTMQLEWVAEHTLLKMTVACELFLERSMGAYVIGERAPSGFRAARTRRLNVPLSEAIRIFRGDRDFVGWISPGLVIQRAEAWLRNGEPFSSALAPMSLLLGYVRLMRNSIVHESESANELFLNRTLALYGPLPGFVTPGRQLCQPCPAGLPGLIGPDLISAIIATYRALAASVVP